MSRTDPRSSITVNPETIWADLNEFYQTVPDPSWEKYAKARQIRQPRGVYQMLRRAGYKLPQKVDKKDQMYWVRLGSPTRQKLLKIAEERKLRPGTLLRKLVEVMLAAPADEQGKRYLLLNTKTCLYAVGYVGATGPVILHETPNAEIAYWPGPIENVPKIKGYSLVVRTVTDRIVWR